MHQIKLKQCKTMSNGVNSGAKKWLYFIAGILVTAGIAVGVYFLFLNDKSSNTPDIDDEEKVEVKMSKEEIVEDDDMVQLQSYDEVELLESEPEEEEVLIEELVSDASSDYYHKEPGTKKQLKKEVVKTATPKIKKENEIVVEDDYIEGTRKMEDKVIVEQKIEGTEGTVHNIVEVMPMFPGGDAAFLTYLSKNLRYPPRAEEMGIKGRVTCQFVVECDGSISDVKVVRGVDPDLDREAVRVLKAMPKWVPGKQEGKSVRVRYTCPINFTLQ